LGDTVGLINGEKRNGNILQALDEVITYQSLRGDIEKIQIARMEHREHAAGLGCLQGGVVKGCLYAAGLEGIDLILHQGNERGDDNPNPRTMEGGNLIAQRFSASRRHEDKGVLAPDETLDDLLLLGAIGFVTEYPLKTFQRIGTHMYGDLFSF
jgi:hypothetical protein